MEMYPKISVFSIFKKVHLFTIFQDWISHLQIKNKIVCGYKYQFNSHFLLLLGADHLIPVSLENNLIILIFSEKNKMLLIFSEK